MKSQDFTSNMGFTKAVLIQIARHILPLPVTHVLNQMYQK